MNKYLILGGVGFGGLIVGILSTAIVFICINRRRKMRYDNEHHYHASKKEKS